MKQRWFYIILIIIVIVVLVFIFAQQNVNSNDLQVIFLDIGQGDSHLIKTPGGQNILIDGGPDNTVLEKLAKYMPFDDTIDLMILTHPHSDHVTGLIEVLRRYKVDRVLATGVLYTTDEYLTWLDIINNKNILFDLAIAPKQYIFSSSEGEPVILDVLYPDRDVSGESFDDVNESSVTVMISYKEKKFLFTGDIPEDIERRIISRGVDLKADVLKVAHQGSDTSSGDEWLAAVKPEYAVIPVGENDYGHPSLRIIRRIERVGAKVVRTDELGDIKFTVDKTGKFDFFGF